MFVNAKVPNQTRRIRMPKNIYRCYKKEIENTKCGNRKVWYTDKQPTYCCSLTPCFFIWEKSTRFNNYNPYSGYIPIKDLEFLD